ncbi:nicotinate-nucleotide--dimethylbenzimidazole phosphoribosyltransferase [Streptomyces sp. V3I7]|uniref:nicotinate-nucleotide--dimethylbenzimidazole phosphoribosyltransferase n=1 Tax=Streptomyces sp. V3I7 TaxID=3042278 RepID=UPI0027817D2F|nr:nicotinate-nucleotide--dimethylbenzimidazole phosphoribosyltransferase [Streptomyces sp. V3I7]MDQ0989862.1 nicotinate-nucleotide--dimethylbenzimidazole phosphoribosyltransferase [Streptomyces sp. V3I7]
MTDTGQIPGEGLPESAGMVEQPGAAAHGAYAYLSEAAVEDEDLLLPGAQGAWGNEVPPPTPEPAPEFVPVTTTHESAGRDSGSVDLGGVRTSDATPPSAMPSPILTAPPGPSAPAPPRRPLHLGPPIPNAAASPVRSLADRGPAGAPVRQPGPPTAGPEYLDAQSTQSVQGAAAWAATPVPQVGVQAPAAETVGPQADPTTPPAAPAPAVPQAAVVDGTGTADMAPMPTAPVTGTGFVPVPPQPQEAVQQVQSVQQVYGLDGVQGVPVPGGVETPEVGQAAVVSEVADGAQDLVSEPGVAAVAPEAHVAPVLQPQPQEGPQFPQPAQMVAEPDAVAPAPEAVPAMPQAAVAAPEAEAPSAAQVQGPQSAPGLLPEQGPAVGLVPDQRAAEDVPQPQQTAEVEPPAEAFVPQAAVIETQPAEAAQLQEAAAPEVEPAEIPQPAPVAAEPEAVQPPPPADVVEPQPQEAPLAAVPQPDAAPAGHPAAELPQPAPEEALPRHPGIAPTAQTPEQPEPFAAGQLQTAPDTAVNHPADDIAAPQTEQPEPDPATAAPAPAPDEVTPLPSAVPLEPHPGQPLGEFVPVDGQVPTAPHLAPTPPHPLVLLTEEQQTEVQQAEVQQPPAALPEQPAQNEAAPAATAPEAAAPEELVLEEVAPEETAPEVAAPDEPVAVGTVPAPREAEPAPAAAPAAAVTEADPEVVQHAEDLDTRAAEQEESAAPVAEAEQPVGPAAPGYSDAEREAVLKVIRERRDIRNGFRSDPIPHEVLLRVLEAAHTAPSVGHSQPWDFVVIRSADTRHSMHELAMRQREAYAKSLPKGRAKQFKELKIEAILDTPVNIVVTADPTRGGRHTLGRHTQPQMAPYSAALAVENLWLAARAEGLGVGWVSFFDEREMVRALGLPEHLEVIAYLCVGYVDEFPDEPELMQAGWSKRRPLSWVVHEETYGRRALPGEEPHDLLAETVAQIRPLDAKALGEAWERQKRMTKPAGALGMLEIISAQLSGLSRQCPPPIPEPAAVAIFAGDHGVHAQGVTPWPQEVTAQMVANFLGGGAVCNAFAAQVGAEVCIVDVGVAAELPATPGLLPRKVRGGTSDMTTGPAMTREEAKQAIEVGIETARDLVAAGNKALLTGEMGIANTTASAALISVFTGADPAEVTGRGTGINDETLARKTEVVRRALEVHQPDPADPVGVLAAVGGFEHAALVGLLLGGASLRTPVILDGVSAGAAALVARAIAPEVLAACIAGHRSAEPGHVAALNKLGLRPLVDLDLRLGEGTGALLALPLVQSTARAMHEVATFDSAGVTEK